MFVVLKTRNRWGRSVTIRMLLFRYVVDVSFCLFLVCFCYVFYSVYGLYYFSYAQYLFCLWPMFLLIMANISSNYGLWQRHVTLYVGAFSTFYLRQTHVDEYENHYPHDGGER